MKKTQQKKQAVEETGKLTTIQFKNLPPLEPDERDTNLEWFCKLTTDRAEFERGRDLAVEQALTLLNQDIKALESIADATERKDFKSSAAQTVMGRIIIMLCKGDLKEAKFCLETGKMPRRR